MKSADLSVGTDYAVRMAVFGKKNIRRVTLVKMESGGRMNVSFPTYRATKCAPVRRGRHLLGHRSQPDHLREGSRYGGPQVQGLCQVMERPPGSSAAHGAPDGSDARTAAQRREEACSAGSVGIVTAPILEVLTHLMSA